VAAGCPPPPSRDCSSRCSHLLRCSSCRPSFAVCRIRHSSARCCPCAPPRLVLPWSSGAGPPATFPACPLRPGGPAVSPRAGCFSAPASGVPLGVSQPSACRPPLRATRFALLAPGPWWLVPRALAGVHFGRCTRSRASPGFRSSFSCRLRCACAVIAGLPRFRPSACRPCLAWYALLSTVGRASCRSLAHARRPSAWPVPASSLGAGLGVVMRLPRLFARPRSPFSVAERLPLRASSPFDGWCLCSSLLVVLSLLTYRRRACLAPPHRPRLSPVVASFGPALGVLLLISYERSRLSRLFPSSPPPRASICLLGRGASGSPAFCPLKTWSGSAPARPCASSACRAAFLPSSRNLPDVTP